MKNTPTNTTTDKTYKGEYTGDGSESYKPNNGPAEYDGDDSYNGPGEYISEKSGYEGQDEYTRKKSGYKGQDEYTDKSSSYKPNNDQGENTGDESRYN